MLVVLVVVFVVVLVLVAVVVLVVVLQWCTGVAGGTFFSKEIDKNLDLEATSFSRIILVMNLLGNQFFPWKTHIFLNRVTPNHICTGLPPPSSLLPFLISRKK